MHDDALLVKGSTRSIVLVQNLTRGQIIQYAGASGDFNPIQNQHGASVFEGHAIVIVAVAEA